MRKKCINKSDFNLKFIFLTLRLSGYIEWKISYDYIIQALKYGIPLIPQVIGIVIIAMTDRIFLSHYIGLEAAGLYTIGYQV